MTLRIVNPTLAAAADHRLELSAEIDGHRLWFRVPEDRPLSQRGEPFLAAAIVAAMSRGQPIELDPELPVCPVFLDGVHQFMDVFRFWGMDLGLELRPVKIQASLADAPPASGVASFFSGGIDGLWTLCTAEPPVETAVFVHGIDFQFDNPMAEEAVRRNREWLATRGIPLVEMTTNIRFVGHQLGIGWNQHNGAGLAAIAHAFGAGTTLIASGTSWHWTKGSGTHVLSDPLLSGSTRRVVHHGHGPMRWQKIERIAQEAGVLDFLRVCWQDQGYNCGRCEKCHRTMLLLHLLGLRSAAFPAMPATTLVPKRIQDSWSFYYARQAEALARTRGQHSIADMLARRIRRGEDRELVRRFDQAFLGGSIRRLRRRILGGRNG